MPLLNHHREQPMRLCVRISMGSSWAQTARGPPARILARRHPSALTCAQHRTHVQSAPLVAPPPAHGCPPNSRHACNGAGPNMRLRAGYYTLHPEGASITIGPNSLHARRPPRAGHCTRSRKFIASRPRQLGQRVCGRKHLPLEFFQRKTCLRQFCKFLRRDNKTALNRV